MEKSKHRSSSSKVDNKERSSQERVKSTPNGKEQSRNNQDLALKQRKERSSNSKTPQNQKHRSAERSSNSTTSSQSFHLHRGMYNPEDRLPESQLDDQRTRELIYPTHATYSTPQVYPAALPHPQNRPVYGYPPPHHPYPSYSYDYNALQYQAPPPYPYSPYDPYHQPVPPPLPYQAMYPPHYRPPPSGVTDYKIAVHQSLEESAMDEKLRRADEEALQKALQLSLDEQDQRYTSFDKADQEALQSALIRSVYDKGGREIGVENRLPSSSHDEELERKQAVEHANQDAVDSGIVRSLYDLRLGSSDSGVPPALSSNSNPQGSYSLDDQEEENPLVMASSSLSPTGRAFTTPATEGVPVPLPPSSSDRKRTPPPSSLHFQPRFSRSHQYQTEEKENY